VQLSLERDGFARETPITILRNQSGFGFAVENRGEDAHASTMRISGLPDGTYTLTVDGAAKQTFTSAQGKPLTLELPVAAAGDRRVEIAPKS
jgi:hypothetical protein